MKTVLKYVFVINLIAFSCQNEKPKESRIEYKMDSFLNFPEQSLIDSNEYSYDTFMFDSVLINDRIPLTLSLNQLIKDLGNPDKITDEIHDCGNSIDGEYKVKKYDYGSSSFYVSINKAQLNILDLTKHNIKINRILIDKNYTLEQFSKDFPNSFKYKEMEKEGMVIWVDMFNKIDGVIFHVDGKYIFRFTKNKISDIELWFDVC